MAEKNPQQKEILQDCISDNESSDEEVNLHLCTSQEEIDYNTIRGSAQATQAAWSYTTAQCGERTRMKTKD